MMAGHSAQYLKMFSKTNKNKLNHEEQLLFHVNVVSVSDKKKLYITVKPHLTHTHAHTHMQTHKIYCFVACRSRTLGKYWFHDVAATPQPAA